MNLFFLCFIRIYFSTRNKKTTLENSKVVNVLYQIDFYKLLIAFKSSNAICKRAINDSSPFLIQTRGS